MYRWLAVAAVVLTLGLGGTAGWYRVVHAASIASALLSGDDLPAGWTVAGALDADAGLPFTCPTRAAPVPPLARLGVLLVGRSVDEMAYQTVSQYLPREAAQVLAAATTESEPCTWTQPLDDGASAEMTLLRPTPVSFGDEAVRRRLVMRSDEFLVEGQIVLMRCGDLVTQLTQLSIGREAGPQDDTLVERLAQAALYRLSLAGQQCGRRLSPSEEPPVAGGER